MVRDKCSLSLASIVSELQRNPQDAQSVLTNLVGLFDRLSSRSSSSLLSLPTGPPLLSDAVKTLHRLLQDYLHSEEEIVWHLCRVIWTWSRACHRFTLEAGKTRVWKTLKLARATYPESPRVLEASLEATTALFHGVELHQLFETRGSTEYELTDELIQLMDRFDNPPARTVLLAPHYDFSTLVVLALAVLCELSASPRVIATSSYGGDEQHTRSLLGRMVAMFPHFLKNAHAVCSWLKMGRLHLATRPRLALQLLFAEQSSCSSWCHRLVDKWHADARIMYDFTAMFTQVFAIPHGSNALPVTALNGEIARSILQHHGVLDIMMYLLSEYATRHQACATSTSDSDRLHPIVLEVLRAIRQLSSVPEMLAVFADISLARKSLVLMLIQQMENCVADLCSGNDPTASQYRMRDLLELALTLQKLAQNRIFARTIKADETLSTLLSQATKRVATLPISTKSPDPNDACDSELPAVLQRELQKTMKVIAALPAPSASSANRRGMQRLPTSSTSTATTRQHSSSRTILTNSSTTTSSHSLRRTPSTSSSSSLVRINSQRQL